MTVYRPSWVVNITLHFDEALLVQTTPTADEFGQDPTPDTPEKVARAALQVGGLEPLVLQPGKLTLLAGIRPLTCSVESATTRQAGKFKMSVTYQDFPLDPRIVRSMSVEIYLASVPDSDWAGGIVGASRPRTSQVQGTVGGQPNMDALLLVGIVDSVHAEHDDKTSRVDLEGRDLRGYFLDGKPAPAHLAKIDLRRPIVSGNTTIPRGFAGGATIRGSGVVEQILALCPFGQNVTVVTDPGEWPDGKIPSPGTADGATRVSLGAKGGGGVAGGPGGAGTGQPAGQQGTSQSSRPSAWGLITQYCFLVGAIPYFEGWTLHVRPARSIFELRAAGLDAEGVKRRAQARASGKNLPDIPTPFRDGQPRDVGEDRPLRYRRLVYGRDVKSLSFERKLAGTKTPTIEVVAIDDRKRGKAKLITAQWPPKEELAARTTSVAPGGQVAQGETLRIPVHGIRDLDQLRGIALGLYEEIGRQEMGGKAETMDLGSYHTRDEDDADTDLCRLRTGDAVEFLVDVRALSSRSPLVAELVDHERRSFGDEVKFIMERLGTDDENLARALVASSRNAVPQGLHTFKVACARHELASGGKTSISFDFQNYVVVRQQVVGEVKRRAGQGAESARTPSHAKSAPQPAKQPQQPESRVGARAPTIVDQGTAFAASRILNLGALGLK